VAICRKATCRWIIALAACWSAPDSAYGGGWNPFARSDAEHEIVETAESKNTGMLNGKKLVRPISSNEGPSVWSRVMGTPRRMMNSLKRAFSSDPSDESQVVSKHSYSTRTTSKKRKSSWFHDEPSEPRTPQEWLAQERPDPFK